MMLKAAAAVLLAVLGATPVAPAPAGSVLASAAARLDNLQRSITGNLAELRASEELNYRRIEGGTRLCMRAAGRAYRQLAFVSFYRDFTNADLGYGIGGATVFDSMTGGGRRMVLTELAYARLQRAGNLGRRVAPADAADLNRCRARYQHREYFDVDPPAGARELAGYEDLTGPVERDPAVRAAWRPYRECMRKRYGYEVPDRDDFLFAPRFGRTDAPLDGRPAGAAWTKGVAATNAALAADADCRRPAYRIAMTLLAPRLTPWERGHRAQLKAIRAAWRKRVADAGAVQHDGRHAPARTR
jgi:hypothetical protein